MWNSSWPRQQCAWAFGGPEADPVGEPLGLAGGGERPVVLVQVAERDGLVDLEQQTQVGQGGFGLGDGQGAVVEGQCVGDPPLRGRR